MSKPNLTISAEPDESGNVAYLALAPKTSNDDPAAHMALRLTIKNNESSKVHVNTLKLSFSGPPAVLDSSIPLDIEIDPGKTQTWFMSQAETLILPFPAPPSITISLSCDGFTDAATLSKSLAAHKSPTPEGSYAFPAIVSDLRVSEYWFGQSHVHGPAGGGVQLFGYDLAVLGWDEGKAQWSALLPNKSGDKNEDYRIWGKPVYAMADGKVVVYDNDRPNNPKPGVDLSPPDPVEGNHYYIQHGDELVLYAHFQKGSLNPDLMKKEGALVKAGQFLGLAGNSGNSSGPHLHIHAIQGTQPWQGAMRPVPFHDINVIDLATLNPPDPSGPWAEADDQGLPATPTLIWPSGTKPGLFLQALPYYVAIDPMALVLSGPVYVKFTLPDPPPIDVFIGQVRAAVKALSHGEKKRAIQRVKTLGASIRALEKELSKNLE